MKMIFGDTVTVKDQPCTVVAKFRDGCYLVSVKGGRHYIYCPECQELYPTNEGHTHESEER